MSKEILIIAGEVSGDMHGAELIKKLKLLEPGIRVSGVGGDLMTAAGMEAFYHIKDFSFLGITEVLKHLPFIFKVQKELLGKIEERKIKTVVLIDYPGFNLNFAKKLKKRNIKVLYYISPQLWAWGKHRVKKMKKLIDRLFVVFPFEVDFFKSHGIKAEFVGHPLMERIDNYKFLSRVEFFKKNSLEPDKEILLIMPGSREHEVKLMLPELTKAGKNLSEEFNLQVVISATENLSLDFYQSIVPDLEVRIVVGKNYELMKYSKFGIIKSGTSTLEAGLFNLPFIVVYKTSRLTYLIAKKLVSLHSLSLVNIVTDKKIVEELIQDEVNAEKIHAVVANYLRDDEKIFKLKEELKSVKKTLGENESKVDLAANILSEINAA